MVLTRLAALKVVTTATMATLGLGGAAAQPRVGAAMPTLPKPCIGDVARAAQWFVRQLDAGTITVEVGPGWRAWRGTTRDEDQVVPVLWIKIEEIDPSSRSAGAVSGWIEVDGTPPGMALAPTTADELPTALPDTHYERSTGRWRLVRALVDGTPKEQAMVQKALDKCAVELAKPPRPPAKKRR